MGPVDVWISTDSVFLIIIPFYIEPIQCADVEHRPCYTLPMLKRSLNRTNPYLVDPAKRHSMFQMTVYTSTGIEGVKLTRSDLLAETRTVRRITSRESEKSSRSPR
jgi:hypothetical protein